MCANFNKSRERLLSEVFSFSAFVWYLKCLMSFLRKPVNPDLSRYNEFEWVARKVSHHAVFFPPMTDFCQITEIFLRFYLTETAKFIWESKASKLKQKIMKQDFMLFKYFVIFLLQRNCHPVKMSLFLHQNNILVADDTQTESLQQCLHCTTGQEVS